MKEFTRREMLRLTLPAFFAISRCLPALAAEAKAANAHGGFQRGDEPINWDAFLEIVVRESERQRDPAWDQEAYVKKIADLSVRLSVDDPKLQQAIAGYRDRRVGRPEFANLLARPYDFQIYLIGFERGEAFEPHDHPDMTGITTVVTGEIDARTYSLLPEPRGAGEFLLREDQRVTVGRGQYGTLTSVSRNIHRLEAMAPSQVIDIFTPGYDRARSARARTYRLDAEPVEGRGKVFRATVGRG